MTLARDLALVGCILAACTADTTSGDASPQVRRILSDDRYDWKMLEGSGTQIHFPAGSFADAHREVLRGRVESALREVGRVLGRPPGEEILHVFYVDGRDDMEALTGTPVTGYSYFDDNALALVFNAEWSPFERHELAHVLTLGGWPDPGDMAVVEGLAT